MNPTVRDTSSVFVSFVTVFFRTSIRGRSGKPRAGSSGSESGDTPQSIETLPYSLPIQKTPVILVGALFREREALKNSKLKTHTKSTAEALRTRSSPAPPWCCCGPPPRPAPVDSSWSNLEKLVSYSLCGRRKPPPRWRVSQSFIHSFIHSSFDALPAPRRRRRRGRRRWVKARFVILRARWRWRTELKIPTRRRSRRPRRAHRRGVDAIKRGESTKRIISNSFASSHPSIDRPTARFAREGLPRKESAKKKSKPRARRREDGWMSGCAQTEHSPRRRRRRRRFLWIQKKRTSSSATSRVQPHRRVHPAPTST